MAVHSPPGKRRQPARARQIERSIRRSVVARNMAAEPVSGVFKAKWAELGIVLICAQCAVQLRGIPVGDSRFDFREIECFVCTRPITNLKDAA